MAFDVEAHLDAADRNDEIRAFLKEHPMTLQEFTAWCRDNGKEDWLCATQTLGSLRSLKRSFRRGR